MGSQPVEYVVPLLFPIVFAAFWLAITWMIGWLSGWHKLADHFPNRPETALKEFSWRSGRMGALGSRYKNILTFGVCRSGLRISVFWMFAASNRPFFVPWDRIRAEDVKGIFYDETRLTFGEPAQGELTILRSLAEEIAKASPSGQWRR